ncbi:peptide-methionine (R)-S-oxide reductase MsrB [Azoarcus sp. TTM-91]|uniref:peptide-methionine (R)-S-oxide reductase MsrB n=1 Tax=Azoarcus sp. TTM-91 TaxID=2691581 RepID=UPI00145F8069|nr:peptide-methionine (R)-S-oxide reductase MsrB [Azoarcus sp. TTM-91]NMG35038.1 peptide-methionine (R)-S-oxide reductase MsrB [Azoarcus sp. TTM-91]
MSRKIKKSDAEWRAALTPMQYHVMREKGTERAFSGEYWNRWDDGTYTCASCGAPLFRSEHKYDAGCGWPSFWTAAEPQNVDTADDHSHFMHRTEVLCHECGAHLGHVFEDGPQPTGLRYCINSASIHLEADAEKAPPGETGEER